MVHTTKQVLSHTGGMVPRRQIVKGGIFLPNWQCVAYISSLDVKYLEKKAGKEREGIRVQGCKKVGRVNGARTEGKGPAMRLQKAPKSHERATTAHESN